MLRYLPTANRNHSIENCIMKKIVLYLLLCVTITGFSQEYQEKHQRAKIMLSASNDLARLANMGIPVTHGTHKKGHFIISDFSVSEIQTARNAGYSVEILIDDSKAYFLQQNRANTAPYKNPTCDSQTTNYQTPANFELGAMGGYLTYQEMLDELDQMKALYPDLITAKSNIGTFLTEGQPDNSTTPSIGGNGIKWVKISDNPDTSSEGEPQILYTAIHHAREPASLSQLIFYMWYLLENYDSDPEIRSIVDNTELYFVPVINPDGYLYNEKTDPNGGGFWRKNRKNGYGTDLNRNYDYYINGDPNNNVWGGEGTSSNTGSEVYHGPAPFSEVETQAIKWFVENHDFVMAFNNHTSGDLLLYPYGYTDNAPTPEDDLFQGVSAELVSRNGFDNIISSDLYPAAGDSDDFMYGTINTHDKIYAFTPEIGPSFWPPSNQIEGICKSMMYLNITAAKMVNNYASVTETSATYVGDQGIVNSTFDVRRLGVSGSGDFTVRIEAVSSNITSVGTPVEITNLSVLQSTSESISYSLAGGTTAGDDIIYDIVVNNGSYDSATRIIKKFGSLTAVFTDEGNSVTTNFNNNGWGVTSSTFVSPSSSITDSPSGNYPNNSSETITLSNAIDLSGATGATASFYAKWEIENNFDYVQFEVSTNGGSSWIPQCGKFTNAGSSNNAQPTGEPLYDGTQNDWVLEEIDLSDYLGSNILVRFRLSSDGGVRGDGFYFDDLKINVVEDTVLTTNDISENSVILYPNPVRDILQVTTNLESYDLDIYNLQGRLIYSAKDNSGSQEIDYSAYAAGMYLLKLTSETASKTFKILKQ